MPPPSIVRTAKGNPIMRNPARVTFAAEELRHHSYSEVRRRIMEQWGVSHATAERDIAAAKQLIALESNYLEVRAGETRRLERIADKAEAIATKAEVAGDLAVASSAHRTAIAASREIGRLNGAYAPKQITVTATIQTEHALQLDAILAVLDETGIAALHVVLAQIEAAKESGRLLPAASEDDEQAELGDGAPSN